jgi:plastocyanin
MRKWASLCILFAACGSNGSGSGGAGGTGGSGGTGGTGTCAAAFAGCTSYMDLTADTANREIAFTFSMYTPNCIKVQTGQTVTFTGSFAQHPLAQSCGPESVLFNTAGMSKSFTFATPGNYGYYCTFHGNQMGQGMAGSIQVVAPLPDGGDTP